MTLKPIHAALIPIMFAHWVGWKVLLAYILFLAAVLLVQKLILAATSYEKPFYLHKVNIGIFIFSSIFIAINIVNVLVDPNTGKVFSYLFQYLSLFLVVAIIMAFRPWGALEISLMARMIFWIAFYSIAVEFIAANIFGVSQLLMPAARQSPSYIGEVMGLFRPFGLTGQPSANGGILLFAFLLLVELRIVCERDAKIIIAFLLGTLLTISGQAIMTNFFIVGLLWIGSLHGSLLKTISIFVLLLCGLLLLSLDFSQKVSLDYLMYVLIERAHIGENLGVLNLWQLCFGTLGSVQVAVETSTEVFLIESVKLFGVVFTLLLWLFIWFLVKGARLRFIWLIACFLSSLHYPTVLYIEAQLPLALLFLSTFSHRNLYSLKIIQRGKDILLPHSPRTSIRPQ